MNEIKCPVCGKVGLTVLSEEEYLCEACGNKFQKHNLSREFQKTDAHIEEVHKDLKETIEKGIGQNNDIEVGFENAYKAAMTSLDHGEFEDAYERFSNLRDIRPWSYKGWYGVFLSRRREGKFAYNCAQRALECEDVTEEVRQDIKAELGKVKEEGLSLIDRIVERNKTAIADLTEKIEQLKTTDPSAELSKAKEQASQMKPKIDGIAKVGTLVTIIAIILILRPWRLVLAAKNLVLAHPILGVLAIVAIIVLVIACFLYIAFFISEGISWLHRMAVRPLVILLFEKKMQDEYTGDKLEEIENQFVNYEISLDAENKSLNNLNEWQEELEEYREICQQANPEVISSYEEWRNMKDRLNLLSETLVSVKLVSLPEHTLGMKSLILKNAPKNVLMDEEWYSGMEEFFGKCEDPTGEWQFPQSWSIEWEDYKIEELQKFCKRYGVETEVQEMDVYKNVAHMFGISMEQASGIKLPAIMCEYFPRRDALKLKDSASFWDGEIEIEEYNVAQ